jgi:hypothetical protein
MHFFATTVLALSFAFSPAGRSWVIRDVLWRRAAEGDFARLSQYFWGQSIHGRQALFRSDGECWEGPYAVVSLNRSLRHLPATATLQLEFLCVGDPEVHRITGNLEGGKRRGREIWIGLTGEPWQRLAAEDILAWRISIYDDTTRFCTKESFLFPVDGSRG